MIKFKSQGDWSRTYSFLKFNRNRRIRQILTRYGELGVSALSASTPKDTGKTAASWEYRVSMDKQGARLEFLNSSIEDGVNIALVLLYGHSANGYWIEGRDYISPALAPLLDNMADEVWETVTGA